MDELEENLLFKLTSIQGPLVDDESLIEVLNVTKITSEEVWLKYQVHLIIVYYYSETWNSSFGSSIKNSA